MYSGSLQSRWSPPDTAPGGMEEAALWKALLLPCTCQLPAEVRASQQVATVLLPMHFYATDTSHLQNLIWNQVMHILEEKD